MSSYFHQTIQIWKIVNDEKNETKILFIFLLDKISLFAAKKKISFDERKNWWKFMKIKKKSLKMCEEKSSRKKSQYCSPEENLRISFCFLFRSKQSSGASSLLSDKSNNVIIFFPTKMEKKWEWGGEKTNSPKTNHSPVAVKHKKIVIKKLFSIFWIHKIRQWRHRAKIKLFPFCILISVWKLTSNENRFCFPKKV